MPELPEVETVRRGLDATIVGRTIDRVAVTGVRTVRASSAEAVGSAARGQAVVATGRHGKWMWLELASGARLYIHLRMSGQLVWCDATVPLVAHTHAVLTCRDFDLRFVDPRTFGEIVPSFDGSPIASVAALGPDALGLPTAGWKAVLAGRRTPLKTLLTDQRRIAGIGNIYADELCARIGVRPTTPTDGLPRTAAARLAAAADELLGAAIKARGSSLADEQYIDLFGVAGGFQRAHLVHARSLCAVCAGPVTRATLGGRTTYWCPRCQK